MTMISCCRFYRKRKDKAMNYWIVVVDDESLSLTHAKSILKEQDMRVSCLRSGRDLLKFMSKNTPDLILLDVQMPEMDGFETYQALRSMEDKAGQAHIPVIFLSGMDDNDAEHRGLKVGASDFIHKPFDKAVLIRRILNAVKNTKVIESLTEEATIDKLTGFLNKTSGTSRVTKLCEDRTGMLAIFDLDNFKLVNDLYGHGMGDRVLKAFSEVVRRNIRSQDVMVRIGGDEFMGFFCNMVDETALAGLNQRLNNQLLREVSNIAGEGFDIPLGISTGAVLVPDQGRDYESLFSLADSALYKVKKSGKHSSELYHQKEDINLSNEEDIKREFSHITQILEERHSRGGALSLGLEQFSFVYRFIRRFYMRYGGMAIKLMFILSEDDPSEEKEYSLNDAAAKFSLCLQDSLRKSDMILQHKTNQFFLLLPELSEQDFPSVLERVKAAWEATDSHEGIHVEYLIEPVVYEKQLYSNETDADSDL